LSDITISHFYTHPQGALIFPSRYKKDIFSVQEKERKGMRWREGERMLLSILNGIYKGQRQSKQSVNRAVSHTYIMMSLAVYTHTHALSHANAYTRTHAHTHKHTHLFIYSFTSTNKQDESGFLCLSLRLFDSEERDIITYGNVDQLGFFYAWLDEKGGLVFPYLMMGKKCCHGLIFCQSLQN